ncbi:MAG: hypothetical protein R3C05_19365 [Pirellulaceae bacterium]
MDLENFSNPETTITGVDDAHYRDKTRGSEVHFSGVVCGGTRFEGMIWDTPRKGWTRCD